MKVAVLGAGVVGIAAAWYLRQAGHEVTVIERREAAGLETSYANGGQISVSHAEPWASPAALRKMLAWLGREDAPLLFRLRADPRQWAWGLRFLAECAPARHRANTARLVQLGLYSRDCLRELRSALGLHYDEQVRGILHFYLDAAEYEAALRTAAFMRALGVERRPLGADEAIGIEPALAPLRARLAGATYCADDESGDAHLFTAQLAERLAATGVEFAYRTEVVRLEAEGDRIVHAVTTTGARIAADAFVVSLGSWTPALVRPLGLRLPIYPVKGYSVTMPVADRARAWTVSLTDEAAKLVFSRLGDRLRIAGTAELTGYDTTLTESRCRAILARTGELFPGAGDTARAVYWAGLRPATPSNVPCLGRSRRHRNLFLDTGHGTLGWTHACGSGRLIADWVDGRKSALDWPELVD